MAAKSSDEDKRSKAEFDRVAYTLEWFDCQLLIVNCRQLLQGESRGGESQAGLDGEVGFEEEVDLREDRD